MRHTERVERINAVIDDHFKSNNGAWWVNNEPYSSANHITLHRGMGGNRIKPQWVALLIFRTEKSVDYIHTSQACYTRNTLKCAGYAF